MRCQNSQNDVKNLKQGCQDNAATAPHRRSRAWYRYYEVKLNSGKFIPPCMYGSIKDSVSEASIDMATILPDKPTLIVCVIKVTQGGVEWTQDFIFRVEHAVIRLSNQV